MRYPGSWYRLSALLAGVFFVATGASQFGGRWGSISVGIILVIYSCTLMISSKLVAIGFHLHRIQTMIEDAQRRRS